MKILSTLHNHCTMCDGRSTPEEMLSAAAAAGFSDLGMSCHGYAPFDPAYSISGEEEYLTAMTALTAAWSDRLRLHTGIEEDLFAPSAMPERYDYRIGDVHYARDRSTGELVPVDGSVEDLHRVIRRLFRGNAMDMVRDYYDNMVAAAERRPLVIGHFDLITKYNQKARFFDEDSDEYRELASQALEACLAGGAVFEINAGAAVKGLRSFFKDCGSLAGRSRCPRTAIMRLFSQPGWIWPPAVRGTLVLKKLCSSLTDASSHFPCKRISGGRLATGRPFSFFSVEKRRSV